MVDKKFVEWLKEVKNVSWKVFMKKDIDERVSLAKEYGKIK